MKNLFTLTTLTAFIFLLACGGGETKKEETSTESDQQIITAEDEAADYSKGIGKFKDVELTHPLDEAMVSKGKEIYDVKCSACHKLDDTRVVGPGWKGVTDRRKPEWIMNFVTNVDEMLNKDPESQAMLEICMVRMPNQNLTDDDARAVLEYMRKNDGKN